MPIITPPDSGGSRPPSSPRVIELPRPNLPPVVLALLGLLVLALLGVGYWWFVQRVEVPAGKVLVLVRRVGESLPAQEVAGEPLSADVRDQIVLYPALLDALGEPHESNRYKGIKYDVLSEGRYFYDPFLWQRILIDAVVIGQNEIGIMIRKYGMPLPARKVVATEDNERGPVAKVLPPGRHNINPFAYEIKRAPQIEIEPGFVGVQRLYHGTDPENPNDWVVKEGERGVQPNVLTQGLYFNNPYVRKIEPIEIRSKTLDLRASDAIRFPSKDSFEIVLEATVEYAVRQDLAPYVKVAFGDHQDIEDKLILPYARAFARIEGSKLVARELIAGETREAFEDSLFEGLRTQCGAQGIEIRATPIRDIKLPAAITGPIMARQVANQQIIEFREKIKTAKSKAVLAQEEELRKQNKALGEAEREVVRVVKRAEEEKAVALTEAQKRLEVARLALEAAKEESAAIISRGRADAEVIQLGYEAEAVPLRSAIGAFGGGDAYAQFFFYQKLSPSLKSILASTDGPFADIFQSLAGARGGDPPPATPSALSADTGREE